jgi:hypothetical protein
MLPKYVKKSESMNHNVVLIVSSFFSSKSAIFLFELVIWRKILIFEWRTLELNSIPRQFTNDLWSDF